MNHAHVDRDRASAAGGLAEPAMSPSEAPVRRLLLAADAAVAVEDFGPDHMLLALRSSEHANGQERGLEERLEKRFGLPLTSYAMDSREHATDPQHP